MNNKNIFARNLKRYMEKKGKSRREICSDLGLSYYTFTDWVNGKKYPRMDKVELLANYFGILKSDLIEDKDDIKENIEKDPVGIANEFADMLMDQDFREAFKIYTELSEDKKKQVRDFVKFIKGN